MRTLPNSDADGVVNENKLLAIFSNMCTDNRITQSTKYNTEIKKETSFQNDKLSLVHLLMQLIETKLLEDLMQ